MLISLYFKNHTTWGIQMYSNLVYFQGTIYIGYGASILNNGVIRVPPLNME